MTIKSKPDDKMVKHVINLLIYDYITRKSEHDYFWKREYLGIIKWSLADYLNMGYKVSKFLTAYKTLEKALEDSIELN